jgi:hypothetical protein
MLKPLEGILALLDLPADDDEDMLSVLGRVRDKIESDRSAQDLTVSEAYQKGLESGRGQSHSDENVSTKIQQIEEGEDDVRYIWDVWLEVGANRSFQVVASCPQIEGGQSVRLLRVDYDGIMRHDLSYMVDHYDTMPWGVDRDRDTLARDE